MRVSGIISSIKPKQQITDKFYKREIWLEIQDGKKTHTLSFEFPNAAGDQLEDYHTGQHVFVDFNVHGRIWKDRVFNTLSGYKIEPVRQADTSTMVRQEDMEDWRESNLPRADDKDDLPF